MNIAQQNADQAARESKTQKFATFVAPKLNKANPKQKSLSDNVQRFLAKKKDETRLQLEQAKLKIENLLELRSHDKKATKRVGQMLRMTKSASKCVIAEAKNSLEDSLAEQDGYQPDEDDYGYVSQHAAEYHKKMMQKYRAIPVNKPIPRPTNNANNPVPTPTKHDNTQLPEFQSLKRVKSPNDHGKPERRGKSSAGKGKRKSAKKPAAPLPLSFTELLQLAEEKCKEPVVIKKLKLEAGDKFEFGRPMTAKEKKAHLIEKAIEDKINREAFNGVRSRSVPGKKAVSRQPIIASASLISSAKSKRVPSAILATSSKRNYSGSKRGRCAPKLSFPPANCDTSPSAKILEISCMSSKFKCETTWVEPSSGSRSQPDSKNLMLRPHHSGQQKYQPSSSKMRPPPPTLVYCNARHGQNKPLFKHRQTIHMEEEIDSEMNGFIDDTNTAGDNVSHIIRNITGYDKRCNVDGSDEECVESSAWEQMKEEARTGKIGRLEDIEDMRKEIEEQRKLQRKMKKLG